MSLQIRNMTESDWEDVSRIYQRGMDLGIATFQTDCPSYDVWNHSHLQACRLVGTGDGGIVGWSALSPYSSRCVYAGVAEVSIYLDPDFHGMGYGTVLLNSMIHESEQSGFWLLQSGILQHNTASIALHKKCGFREVGYREKIARDRDGIWRNTVLMERRSPLENYNEGLVELVREKIS
jgi:Sortase and related acyltransferases